MNLSSFFREPFGFIIIRHARTRTDDIIGEKCFNSIRKLYPNTHIVVVDDHSSFTTPTYLDTRSTFVSSHLPAGVGEMLAWYYFYTQHPFVTACVLHDSMALADFLPPLQTEGFLWHFDGDHMLGNHTEEILVSQLFEKKINVWKSMVTEKNKWKGCFGMCGVFSWESMHRLNDQTGMLERSFLENVKTRTDRMAMERIFGWGCQVTGIAKVSFFGDIHTYPNAFIPSNDASVEQCLETQIENKKSCVVKVWRGR